jgi:intracellular multiplication protein IcmP
MEAIGAMCHYKAEKLAQRPIPRPKMEDAVSSISDYMSSDTARPIPPLDYSKSKKRAIKKVRGS